MTSVGGAWAATGISYSSGVDAYLPSRDTAFHTAPKHPCLTISVFFPQQASGNHFLSLHVSLSVVWGGSAPILNSTKHQNSSSTGVKHLTVSSWETKLGFLQSSLGLDLQRNIGKPQKSHITEYFLESGRTVTKLLDCLPAQVHYMSI